MKKKNFGKQIQNLLHLNNTLFLATALFATSLAATSCDDKDDIPAPISKPSATSHHFNTNGMAALDSDIRTITSKADGNSGRDTVYVNFTDHLKVSKDNQTPDFETLQKLVDLSGKSNVHFEWNDHGVYAGGDMTLSSKNAATLADLLASGAKLLVFDGKMFYISSVDAALFGAPYLAQMGSAHEKIIRNADEFVEKCRSANAGDLIIIDGNVGTSIDHAVELGSAIERRCDLRLSENGTLEFVVEEDVNLAHKKLDVISNNLGDAKIRVKVKTDQSGKPFITVFNDPLFKNAMTKATFGKHDYNITFVDNGGQVTNPRVCGTRDLNDHWTKITDSTYFASLTKIDVGVRGTMTGSWEILRESGHLNDIGFENGVYTSQLVTSPTGTIDFNYPMPSVAGSYAQDKPNLIWWQGPMPNKLTYVSVGDWFGNRVLSGLTNGANGPAVMDYLGFSYNPYNLNIRNADSLAFCCHFSSFLPLINGQSGSIYNRGKDALRNLQNVAKYIQDEWQLYITTSSGVAVEQIVVLDGSMDPTHYPYPNPGYEDFTGGNGKVLLLNPQVVR
jgi:hypothetical protein